MRDSHPIVALCGLLAFATACNAQEADQQETVDIPTPIYGSTKTNSTNTSATVLVAESSLYGFAVSKSQLYWISRDERSDQGPNDTSSYDLSLRHCDVENCEKSVKSLTFPRSGPIEFISQSPHKTSVVSLAVGNARLWVTFSDGEGGFGIYSCETPSCRKLSLLPLGPTIVTALHADHNKLVFATTEASLLSCDESSCAGTLSQINVQAPGGDLSNSNTKWISDITSDEKFYYLYDRQKIVRVVKDGSLPYEVLAKQVGQLGAFTVRGDRLYWTETFPARLLSCPSSGCVGDPTVVTDALHAPRALVSDNSGIYVSEPSQRETVDTWQLPALGSNEILKCNDLGCSRYSHADYAAAKAFQDMNNLGPLQVDSDSLYYEFSGTTVDGFSTPYFGVMRLRKDAPLTPRS